MNKGKISEFFQRFRTVVKEKWQFFLSDTLPRAIGKGIALSKNLWQRGKTWLTETCWPVIKEKGPAVCRKAMPYLLTVAVTATVTAVIVGMPYWKLNGYTKLSELEALVAERFVGNVDKTAMEDAAARAMIDALGDRWSYYVPADEYDDYLAGKQNAYVGIGVTIRQNQDGLGLDVVEVTQGGGAQKAGILPGDIIVAVDGTPIAGMATETVRGMIRGQANTQVKITVKRSAEETTYEVTRAYIPTKVAEGYLVHDTVGVVKIVNFNENCATQTIAVIEVLIGQGATKLVFDVRNNPGGYATEMVKVLDYLLPEGVVFHAVDYKGREDIQTSGESCLNLPMTVLVNGNTYSAAEYFAVTISEYQKGKIVGEQTSGKGYFQNSFRLSDGSAIGLSVGKYFTPIHGLNLEGKGLTPDISVPVSAEVAAGIQSGTLSYEQDPQLQAAVNALMAQ